MAEDVEHVIAGGVRIAYRRTGGDGIPTLYFHGVPTDSRDWLPFLDRSRGPALAFDLPGFGASERPPANEFDYSMGGLARTVEAAVAELGIDEYRLVVHDWGVVALVAALAAPERVRSLVVINAVPILPGYRWHRTARVWRTRGAGEAFFVTTTRALVRVSLREGRHAFRRMPPEFEDVVWECVRHPSTQAGILALYRSADPAALAVAGAGLERLGCPALVLWGTVDRFIAPRFGADFAARIPGAEHEELADAGHWPWVDRPDVVEKTVSFLDSPT